MLNEIISNCWEMELNDVLIYGDKITISDGNGVSCIIDHRDSICDHTVATLLFVLDGFIYTRYDLDDDEDDIAAFETMHEGEHMFSGVTKFVSRWRNSDGEHFTLEHPGGTALPSAVVEHIDRLRAEQLK